MNERIEQLVNEAGHTTLPNFSNSIDPMFAEKFAELIVRECMMLVEGFESTQEVALDEYVDYEASAVLKEHFGVEV